jgi:hypothetical protein
MEQISLLSIFLALLSGSLGGFLSSYFFYNKAVAKDRPRIKIVERSGDGRVHFDIRNVGFSHILCLKYSLNNEAPVLLGDVSPQDSVNICSLNIDEWSEIKLYYNDPWNRSYDEKWQIEISSVYIGDEAPTDYEVRITKV